MKTRSFYSLIFFSLFFIWANQLNADNQLSHVLHFEKPAPWFTGPLIAPSAYTMKPGHYNIQPYIYCDVETAQYNSHWKAESQPQFIANTFQVQGKIGLLPSYDFQFHPQMISNVTQNRSYTNIGDLPFALNIQLLHSEVKDPWPAIKLSLGASIPLGKYQHLKASRKKTDSIGSGTWFPNVVLVIGKVIDLSDIHFLDTRLALTYQFGASVHVNGLNAYGGAPNTYGTAYPGNTFIVDGALQYNLTQEWAIACDFYYSHSDRNRFSGYTGSFDGQPAKMTGPSSEQWSLAPAIEYNWNKSVGLLAGVWFSVAGRNTSRFINGIISLNIYI